MLIYKILKQFRNNYPDSYDSEINQHNEKERSFAYLKCFITLQVVFKLILFKRVAGLCTVWFEFGNDGSQMYEGVVCVEKLFYLVVLCF